MIRFVDGTFLFWAALGLAIPFGLGVALGGTIVAGLTGLLWGGAVRVFVVHHVTYSINSLCHTFGRQPFKTKDESRNLAWLAPFTFGEAWHNNHHAFPTSAVARHPALADRLVRGRDLGAREARPRVGRGADQPRSPGEEARR